MAITELLRCISHSLRSPLQTLHAGLSQLTATTATADDGTLDDMRLAADAASRVLDDIVNYHELLLRLGLKTRPPSPAKSKVNLSHIISSSISLSMSVIRGAPACRSVRVVRPRHLCWQPNCPDSLGLLVCSQRIREASSPATWTTRK